jgi:hypothetical protein
MIANENMKIIKIKFFIGRLKAVNKNSIFEAFVLLFFTKE